jgi:hypothetical protein
MLSLHTLRSAWLAAAAFFAGGINAIAGGGSLLSFPALLQAGILPVQANATNSVALMPGQFASAAAYRRELQRHRSLLVSLLLAAFTGGLLGARLLLATRQEQFLHLVPWLLLTATMLFAGGPPLQQRLTQKLTAPDVPHPSGLRPLARILLPIGIFAICLYVGFFRAGSGLMIMGVLSFAGIESVHEINALKTAIISVSSIVATVTFLFYGAVLWHYGLLMMLAAGIGGYASARVARRHKPRGIRMAIIAMGCVVTLYYFWKVY